MPRLQAQLPNLDARLLNLDTPLPILDAPAPKTPVPNLDASVLSRDRQGAVIEFHDLGRMGFQQAYEVQQDLSNRRKQDLIPNQFLIVEHPHVITLGRNSKDSNILASPEILARAGIEIHSTDRGGDVTYHGPGQIVCYPIMNLKAWKRDVTAYVRAIEQTIINALADFGIHGERLAGCTGVWVNGAKIAAIGIHISRWVTSHGFALNLETDLNYFRYIVPCGLTKPVTSLRALGCQADRAAVIASLFRNFTEEFQLDERIA